MFQRKSRRFRRHSSDRGHSLHGNGHVKTRLRSNNFSNNPDLHLAERLLLAIQAGVDAGGEEGPVHSAGLKVAFDHSWPLVDLRVDWAEEKPVSQLMSLWKSYESQSDDYNARAVNPTEAPSYGVPGDE